VKKIAEINSSWSLFLDRDGVINRKLDGDYVKKVEEFEFIEGVPAAVARFSSFFQRVMLVTNQQGIGKGIMTHEDLKQVHDFMEEGLREAGGYLDRIYYCPELAAKNAPCRKPNTGMAEQAQRDFPEIRFEHSLMVGDSLSDLEMGKRLGMTTVFISDAAEQPEMADYVFKSLPELQKHLGC
jgi:histidinol-phosphate phosphatase family protein